MFDRLNAAPPDAILGLTEAFKKDSNPAKINLGVGVFRDAKGTTPILESVKRAEAKLLEKETTKNYVGIPGDAAYGAKVRDMLFGAEHEIITSGRAATAHTPGGTGALRVAGDFIHKMLPDAAIWMSSPTWANHPAVFDAAGVEVKTYPYYDPANKTLDFDAMMEGLRQIPAGDVVLLHGCCHNPTGVDPDLGQWKAIAALMKEQGLLPLIDFAYQGFGDGLEEDAAGLREFCTPGCELLICSSFSKNFGLYNERVGALTVVAASSEDLGKAFSNVKVCVRSNYSNPPFHGGGIVHEILADPELTALWQRELKEMRERINGMRKLFADTMRAKTDKMDFGFLVDERGMFSMSGLNKDQVNALREQYSIYIVGSGRINVAGMTEDNMEGLCDAIAAVL